ncbi:hypothetical protein F2Q69_00022556 [Brassica cretica]|uniref:Uncharacterized protein n=1 Tax=Brassica cretica TaxID=69181 RepID=A0A8S9Q108_BRACR|nr:hypothetical protein F2Q69_00022556 [Brassica cretica]
MEGSFSVSTNKDPYVLYEFDVSSYSSLKSNKFWKQREFGGYSDFTRLVCPHTSLFVQRYFYRDFGKLRMKEERARRFSVFKEYNREGREVLQIYSLISFRSQKLVSFFLPHFSSIQISIQNKWGATLLGIRLKELSGILDLYLKLRFWRSLQAELILYKIFATKSFACGVTRTSLGFGFQGISINILCETWTDYSIGISINILCETWTDYSIGISIDALGQALMRGLNMLTKLPISALAYLAILSQLGWIQDGHKICSAHILASPSTDAKAVSSIDGPSSPRQVPLSRQTDYFSVKRA